MLSGAMAGGSDRFRASSDYELLARLAAGGMAEIFLARANSMAGFERYVVLKRIRPDRTEPRYVSMFLDEARLAAHLHHPNVAQVFDLGRISDDYFYTMEYVHGEDVLAILERASSLKQRIPIHVALAIVTGAAAGLAHAHERCGPDGISLGIVHRDISPANLMVSYDGMVKVVDFGVAKARLCSTATEAGTVVGKLAYLSPEQVLTGSVDHRSDIFSLGIVLYEMLTMTRLFKRDTDFETLRAVTHHTPPSPSVHAPSSPVALDRIVMTALAKNPDERFPTMTAMLEAIEQVAEHSGMAITNGVLRRYMKQLFGGRPEPWRELERSIQVVEDLDLEPLEDTPAGFPLDVSAEQVPLLSHQHSWTAVSPDADEPPKPLEPRSARFRAAIPTPISQRAIAVPARRRLQSSITIVATVSIVISVALAIQPFVAASTPAQRQLAPPVSVTPIENRRTPAPPPAPAPTPPAPAATVPTPTIAAPKKKAKKHSKRTALENVPSVTAADPSCADLFACRR